MNVDDQLDLFAEAGWKAASEPPLRALVSRRDPTALDEAGLIAAIPDAGLSDHAALADEAVRRRLFVAVPALEALCGRFKGFGLAHAVPEQTAALRALAELGGVDAGAAVARIIAGEVVQGPGLVEAVRAAAALGCRLAPDTCLPLLRHPNPEMRATAARLTRSRADVIVVLLDLLDDLDGTVVRAAACALGRMGRAEARPALIGMLMQRPSADLIEAIAAVADDHVVVLLGRIGRTRSDLTSLVVETLGEIESPKAAIVTMSLQTARPA